MNRKIVITLDLDDAGEFGDADIAATIRARLDEVYASDGGVMQPTDVRVSVMNTEAVDALLRAAEVGLDGSEGWLDELDAVHAEQIIDDLRAGV